MKLGEIVSECIDVDMTRVNAHELSSPRRVSAPTLANLDKSMNADLFDSPRNNVDVSSVVAHASSNPNTSMLRNSVPPLNSA